jgi:uncharacterized protein
MPPSIERKRDTEKVADIIRDAGGKIVGRTRLQKIAYLLELAGVGSGFSFEYRHYGPYSEELASAARMAAVIGLIEEEERPASWGGSYSVFTVKASRRNATHPSRIALAREAEAADPIELELAATAAFLAAKGSDDPWKLTAKLKPEKVGGGHLENAKILYRKLQVLKTPKKLPNIG